MRICGSLLCGLLAVCGLLTAAQLGSGPSLALTPLTIKIDPTLKNHGVTIRTGSSPDFDSVLTSNLGAATTQSLAPLKGYMLIISNDSGQTITAMRVRYTRNMRTGRAAYSDLPYGSHDLYTQRGLRPGTTVIAAPGMNTMRNIAQVQLARQVGSTSNLHAQNYMFQAADFNSIRGELNSDLYTSASVSVDSVVFEDGTVIGPDAWGAVDDHQARVQALTEILFQVRDNNISDTALQTWLSSKASQNFLASGILDHYVYNDVELARIAQGAVRLNGRPYAVKLLASMLNHGQAIVLRKVN